MRRITEATARSGYRLFIRFEDGANGEVDLSELVGKGIFSSWKDQSVFAKVGIDRVSGTVSWPGGIDLDPDNLYHDITGAPNPGASQVTSA